MSAIRNIGKLVARKMGALTGSIFCKVRQGYAAEIVAEFQEQFLYRFCNVNFNCETNGELRVIRSVLTVVETERDGKRRKETGRRGDGNAVFLDVGANVGDWARLVECMNGFAEIHCFEPHPETFNALQKSLSGSNFKFHRLALGKRSGAAMLFAAGGGDVCASLVNWKDNPEREGDDQMIEICRGDEFLSKIGTSQVALLKIDVEGAEMEVLEGFGHALQNVRCIQFEYGVPNISSRYLLKDLYCFLVEKGFEIGVVYPSGVRFSNWHPRMERFLGNNYIAVRANDQTLQRQLSGRFHKD